MKEFVRAKVGGAINFWKKYEHHLGVGALTVGFIFDLFIAKKPDSVIDNILLCSYLFIAGAVIILLNIRARRRTDVAEPLLMLLMLQFCFGGLSSNLLVLYGKSGTLAGSAIFLGLLLCLVLGNEYLRNRYAQLRFNIVVYYFLLLTYCIIAVPTFITHSIGTGVFLASESLSLMRYRGVSRDTLRGGVARQPTKAAAKKFQSSWRSYLPFLTGCIFLISSRPCRSRSKTSACTTRSSNLLRAIIWRSTSLPPGMCFGAIRPPRLITRRARARTASLRCTRRPTLRRPFITSGSITTPRQTHGTRSRASPSR